MTQMRDEFNTKVKPLLDKMTGTCLDIAPGTKPHNKTTHTLGKGKKYTYNCDLNEEFFVPKYKEFDNVTCFWVLEHTMKPMPIITKILEHTKVGGTVIIAVPSQYRYHRDPHDYWRFQIDWAKWVANELVDSKIIPLCGNRINATGYIITGKRGKWKQKWDWNDL